MNTRIITHVGLSLALATLLHLITIYHLPQGGSITPGSMVPLIMIAVYYGPRIGCLAGMLFGFLNLLIHPFIVHPVQLLLDYPLAFLCIGLAGLFKKPIIGAIVGLTGRFLCHFISGVIFFASYAPAGMSPWWYSLVANGLFMGVEGSICVLIMSVLPLNLLFSVLGGNSKTK